jgi:hypothetical protein
MARVVAYIPDLLFGSRVQADLIAAGHTVALIGDSEAVESVLAGARVLVVDLTDEDYGGALLVESLSMRGLLAGVCTLAFYSHVDAEMRARGEDAGFDMIVPRSRMAREGPGLVAKLVQGEADKELPSPLG